MPLCLEPGCAWAMMMATSAIVPLLIHTFWPDSSQSSPSRMAVVEMLPASEPALGSVMPKQPTISPLHRRGRYSCFCSSVPQRRIVNSTSDICTDRVVRMLESAYPISSKTIASEM